MSVHQSTSPSDQDLRSIIDAGSSHNLVKSTKILDYGSETAHEQLTVTGFACKEIKTISSGTITVYSDTGKQIVLNPVSVVPSLKHDLLSE